MNQLDKENQKSNISFQQVSWGLLAVVAVLFVVLNSDKSEMNLIFIKPELPLFVLVLTSMLVGFLLAKLTGRRKKDD
ncbi:MAG: hypothetical protein NWR88_04425 [Ilumatobacteraceae bacterium]|jgi:uncharacterized integral membrane protein|nr:hypothetical protein [Ilumatobacteraceae bacterium]